MQLARGLDLDDLKHVGVDADIQQQRKARAAVGVDRRTALCRHAYRSERDGYVELDGEHVALQRQRDAAGGRGEAEEGDRTVDVELEAGLDGDLRAVRLGQYLLVQRANIKLERCAGLERQADVSTEARLQTEVGVGGESVAVETEHGIDVELADTQQFHLGLGPDLDGERVRAENELEAAADLDRAADLEHALEDEADARIDGDVAEDEEAGIRIGGEDVRLRARVGRIVFLVGLEAGDRLGRGIRVELEQELATDRHARDLAAVGQRQLHPTDDPGAVAVEVGVEEQVEAAGQRADVLDLRAYGAGDAHETVAAQIDRRREGNLAGQRDRVEQLDAALDVSGNVKLGSRTHAHAAVDLGRRGVDNHRRFRIVGQQGEETLRNLKHLLAQRRVERDLDGSTQFEDAIQCGSLFAPSGAVGRRAERQFEIEHHRNAGQARIAWSGQRSIEDDQADCLAVETQCRYLGLGLNEDFEALGGDAQIEATEQPYRIVGVLIR